MIAVPQMVKRPTMVDLATAAGVSIATVDRVLNQRLPVTSDTAQRVLKAAETINFHATPLLRKRLEEKPVRRFGFLLQKKYAFYEQLGEKLVSVTKSAQTIEGKAQLDFMDELDPALFVRRLHEIARRADAIAIVAMDHPQINQAIEEIVASGTSVFTLLSPINTQACTGHLGLDSRKCGRIAGWLTHLAVKAPGKIGILVGSHSYINHEISEISFRTYLREHAPHLQLLEPIVNLDDETIAYEAVTEMIRTYPDLQAVYVAGGGQEGLIRALRETQDRPRPIAVCNELTNVTREALIDGTIDLTLCTPISNLAQKVVAQMIDASTDRRIEQAQILFAPDIIIRENL
jgi:LacI family transcriptional regulator